MTGLAKPRSTLVLGTRGSKLAVHQSEWVQARLKEVAPQVAVYACAITWIHHEEFTDCRATLPWRYLGSVQPFVNEEHDTCFAVYLATADRT